MTDTHRIIPSVLYFDFSHVSSPIALVRCMDYMVLKTLGLQAVDVPKVGVRRHMEILLNRYRDTLAMLRCYEGKFSGVAKERLERSKT